MTADLCEAGAAHAEVLAALHADCFPTPWTAAEIGRLLALPGMFALLALTAGAPRAFVVARVAADEAEIVTIGTHPSARRNGLAAALFGAAGAHAARHGARSLFLEVAADNAAARRLYEAHGCAEIGRRHNYYKRENGVCMDAVILGKTLDETKESR